MTIELTLHCVERFCERFRPGLAYERAEDELAWLVTLARVTADPPAWLAARTTTHADAYAVVGDLVLPLHAEPDGTLVASTCLARGGLSETARRRRNARRPRRAAYVAG